MPSAVRPFRLWNSVTALCVPVEYRPSIVPGRAQPSFRSAAPANRSRRCPSSRRGARDSPRCNPAEVCQLCAPGATCGCRCRRRRRQAAAGPILPRALVAGLPRVRRGGRRVLRHRGRRIRRQRLYRAERNRPVADLQRIEVGPKLMKQPVRPPSMPASIAASAIFLMFRFTLPPPFRQESRPPRPATRFRMQSASPLLLAAPSSG